MQGGQQVLKQHFQQSTFSTSFFKILIIHSFAGSKKMDKWSGWMDCKEEWEMALAIEGSEI